MEKLYATLIEMNVNSFDILRNVQNNKRQTPQEKNGQRHKRNTKC